MARIMSYDDTDINNGPWEVNIHDFEHNGSLTASISIDSEQIHSNQFYLAAFEDNQCVGTAYPVLFPLTDSYIFQLMVYNNKEYAELDLKLYDEINDIYYEISESIDLYSDRRLGDGLSTVDFNVHSNELPDVINISSAYPNPFNPTVNIVIELDESSNIKATIYNLKGQLVSTIVNGTLDYGVNNVMWDANNFPSGIYFINIESNGQLLSTQKISLLK